MRVLVTGSRDWPDEFAVWSALDTVWGMSDAKTMTVVHGGARGADRHADNWVRFHNPSVVQVEVHHANWERDGKAAGPIRNQRMVELGADLCLAFPLGESRGTRHCMAAAAKAGIPVEDCTQLVPGQEAGA